MNPTYDDYLKEPRSLTLEEMQEIHRMVLDEIRTDTEAAELYGELCGTAVKYASIRARWPALSRQEKCDLDSRRSACHDSVIVKCNMLARYLCMQGKEAAWREMLGDEAADPYNRKRIGDFACYLAFVSSLYSR